MCMRTVGCLPATLSSYDHLPNDRCTRVSIVKLIAKVVLYAKVVRLNYNQLVMKTNSYKEVNII